MTPDHDTEHDGDHDDGTLATDRILVRELRAADLAAIVKIDKASTGLTRQDYYAAKVRTALNEPGVRTSLVAEEDGHVVGFLLVRVFYGEFGRAEPAAFIDSVGVGPAFRGRHVGQALLRQLVLNLRALHVERVETLVGWSQLDLLAFVSRNGFRPAARVCVELRLDG